MILAPCIEWHFAECGDMGARVRAAHAAGFSAAEFHLWRDKDLAGVAAAIADTGLNLTGICADPRRSLVDPAQHDELAGAVADTIAAAAGIGNPPIIVASGFCREGVSQQEHFDCAVAGLSRLARMAEDAGAMLMLEPLNDRIDHPGMYLVSTTLGLDLVQAVGSPALRLLWDAYHSAVMGEDPAAVLTGRIDLVHHVQVADLPGRNEPGTGTIDWPALVALLGRLGYRGALGMEYRPTLPIAQSHAIARATLGV